MAQGAEADRLTSVEERQKIQYYSQSFEKWLRARVLRTLATELKAG